MIVHLFFLRYPLLMTVPNMLGLTVFSWIIAHIFPGIGTINFTFASFCGPNRIIQAFCDTLSLTALVCGETNQYGASYGAAMFILYFPLGFIIVSYFWIIFSVFRMSNNQVKFTFHCFFLRILYLQINEINKISHREKRKPFLPVPPKALSSRSTTCHAFSSTPHRSFLT